MTEADAEEPLYLDDFKVNKTEIVADDIRKYKTEGQFTGLAVELLKEAAITITIATCAYGADESGKPRKWTRNEAVLNGLAIRMTKLMHGILDQTCQKRREIVEILFRCLSETVINLKYLIKNSSNEIFDEYIGYSLREEKRLLKKIEENIAKRGKELPIEKRMLRSIAASFNDSGVKPEQVDETDRDPWGKSIFERAKQVGLKDAYQGLISMASHAVHGNWQDLISHHLEIKEDGFLPETRWTSPKPQPLFVAALITLDACEDYVSYLFPESDDKTKMRKSLADCKARAIEADCLHEDFLTSRQ